MLIFGTSLNKTFFENLSLKVSLPFVNTSGTKLTVILNMLYISIHNIYIYNKNIKKIRITELFVFFFFSITQKIVS